MSMVLSYRRLIDADYEGENKTVASEKRRRSTVVVVVIIAASVACLAAIGLMVALVAVVVSLQGVVCVSGHDSSSLQVEAAASPATPDGADVKHLLQRLASLEREMVTLRRQCRRCELQGNSEQSSGEQRELGHRQTRSKHRQKSRDSRRELNVDSTDERGKRREHDAKRGRKKDAKKDCSSSSSSSLSADGGERLDAVDSGSSRRDFTGHGMLAHVVGGRNGHVDIGSDGLVDGPGTWRLADWMEDESEWFSLNLFGHLVVREDGIYYVYSQLLFYDDNSTVGQSIYVDEVAHFTCTKSNISARAKQSTCYVGGLVRMSSGQGVSIRLSVPSLTIALYADTSYFGLFRVA